MYGFTEHQRHVSYYAESGEWLDGDSRLLRDRGKTSESYDPDFDDEGSPVLWAIDRLRRANLEASAYPIPDEVGEHVWLSECYEHPEGYHVETTVYLVGDWTPGERATVMRGATAR
jgi:hypothetical protein